MPAEQARPGYDEHFHLVIQLNCSNMFWLVLSGLLFDSTHAPAWGPGGSCYPDQSGRDPRIRLYLIGYEATQVRELENTFLVDVSPIAEGYTAINVSPEPAFQHAGAFIFFRDKGGKIVGSCTPSSGCTEPLAAASDSPTPKTAWATYHDPAGHFEFKHPGGEGVPTDQPGIVRINLPFADGTNLRGKALDISTAEATNDCARSSEPLFGEGQVLQGPAVAVDINGTRFVVQHNQNGAGTLSYRVSAYSAARGNECADLAFILVSSGALLDATHVQFDEGAESAVFDQILATFRWLEN